MVSWIHECLWKKQTFPLDDQPRDTGSSVCRHLLGPKSATLEALFAQLRGAVLQLAVSLPAHMLKISSPHLLGDRLLYRSQLLSCCQGWSRINIPRMPPNRKTSKLAPSSGARSLAAAGSKRHTRDLSWA